MSLSGDSSDGFAELTALAEKRDRDVIEITQRLHGLVKDVTGCVNCAEMRVQCVEAALSDLSDRLGRACEKMNELYGPVE